MITRIRQLLAAPVFADEEKTSATDLLNTILLAILAVTTVSSIIFLIKLPDPLYSTVVHIIIILLILGALFLMRRGHIRLASILFSAGVWLTITVTALFFGGVRGFPFTALVLVILIAGLLLGGRTGIGFAALSIIAGWGMLYAELSGFFSPLFVHLPPTSAWLTKTIYFIVAAILLHIYTHNLNNALKRAHHHERALAESNHNLQTAYASLEMQTAEVIETNADLQREISERRRAEEQVRISLQEKEVLLKEIHHRVKNNLQVISSLLNLQSHYVNEQQALESFQDSQHRIRSMALIHEKLYQSESLAQIDFAEYIRDLTAYLFQAQGAHTRHLTLNVQADEVLLSLDTAIPCGLLLNELVSNALQHAFPDGRPGEIRIELNLCHNSQVTLTVGDNGIGFPAALDFQNTTSLGLQLVNTLVDQLEGAIQLDRSHGTKFLITFAASSEKETRG